MPDLMPDPFVEPLSCRTFSMNDSQPTDDPASLETLGDAQSSISATSTATERPPLAAKYYAKPGDSYVKLAMRNMVRRGKTSLTHFALTTVGLLALLVGLAYAFH